MPPELMTWLLTAAAQLSGYPPIPVAELPPVVALAPAELADRVCPQHPGDCDTLAAVYDTDRHLILVSDRLDLEDDADNSFLLHEIVHVLQHRAHGESIYADCDATLATEREAYAVQNRYLEHRGQFRRAGEMLRYMRCAPAQDSGADSVRLEHASGVLGAERH